MCVCVCRHGVYFTTVTKCCGSVAPPFLLPQTPSRWRHLNMAVNLGACWKCLEKWSFATAVTFSDPQWLQSLLLCPDARAATSCFLFSQETLTLAPLCFQPSGDDADWLKSGSLQHGKSRSLDLNPVSAALAMFSWTQKNRPNQIKNASVNR